MKSRSALLLLTMSSSMALLNNGQGCAWDITHAQAKSPGIGIVTIVQGNVQRAAGLKGRWQKLNQGMTVIQADRLKTQVNSRLEIKLKDASFLRLGSNSEINLESLNFKKKKTKVRAKLIVGKIWASVVKLFGRDSTFEVQTPSAVAGVRGTRFQTLVNPSGETIVKVLDGQVLVSNKPSYAIKGHSKAKRLQVAGPQEISKQQWEELMISAMQMVKIKANGEMETAQKWDRSIADPKNDAWEAWNLERDKLANIRE